MNNKYNQKYLIEIGIGLQAVDGLEGSKYFSEQTKRYINGEISIKELQDLISDYYKSKPDEFIKTGESDTVAIKIAELLSDDSFSFSVGQLVSIHRSLFSDVYHHAGKLRKFNFTKSEWVLDGESVIYGDYRELEKTLAYDLNVEKKKNYALLSRDEMVNELAIFIANLWQIHPFSEGNTRTVAVFLIKYLRSLGFDVTNDTFKNNSWYFRNALVRANYNNVPAGIYEDRSYLIMFLRNLIFKERNELLNREAHIRYQKLDKVLRTRKDIIVYFIRENPKITADELSKKISVSRRTIINELNSLQDSNIIERINGKKHGFWKSKSQFVHKMNLHDKPFKVIENGLKTIEMRLNDIKRQKIKEDDFLEFTNIKNQKKIYCLVKSINEYKDFDELYKHYDKISLGYKENETASPSDMSTYYSKEDITKYGVLAIEIKKL
ncbi:MAG TPA: Fic family protein [Bacilli bacterium]|nr:Fic family protein [Bacilli bacterium]